MASSYGTIEYYQERASDFMSDCIKAADEYKERERLIAIERDIERDNKAAAVRWKNLMNKLNHIPNNAAKLASKRIKSFVNV